MSEKPAAQPGAPKLTTATPPSIVSVTRTEPMRVVESKVKRSAVHAPAPPAGPDTTAAEEDTAELAPHDASPA